MNDEKILLSLLKLNASDFGLYIGSQLKELNYPKTKFSKLIYKDERNTRILCNGYRKIISNDERFEILEKLEEVKKKRV